MRYRELGATGLRVSEIGFGGEWITGKDRDADVALIEHCRQAGINIVDCWMADPAVRSALGAGLAGHREEWVVQGHLGSTWQNGQYVRTRDMDAVKPAFEDLLARLDTDYIDLGMIHYVDELEDWEACSAPDSPFLAYVRELKEAGTIRHIGLSSHSPEVALAAAKSGLVEAIMFSINPAFDMLPATADLDAAFTDTTYDDAHLAGIDPVRAELYRTCEMLGVGLTVMKPFAGGRLLDAARSPFKVALTPAQCIHYCLTRPAVASVLAGYATPAEVDAALAYETAKEKERDYASVLAKAPRHTYRGQCTYCGHCKPCPFDIDIAMVNKFLDLALMAVAAAGNPKKRAERRAAVPASVAGHYDALRNHAGDCIGCGACLRRCPFGVDVPERMILARELFGE
ncbi:MAG: aldo/keto reductase [Eggerthellaceae bacterium]|nr:aldo/keto reductase [Eggerthellaceae bacterium]